MVYGGCGGCGCSGDWGGALVDWGLGWRTSTTLFNKGVPSSVQKVLK